jgi:biopolymer transport protein ExbD
VPTMKGNQRKNLTEEDFGGLDISSLIDVSFLLLIYFLITSTLAPRESDLALTMPIDKGGPSTNQFVPDTPCIEVDSNGVVIMDEEVLDSDLSTRQLALLEDRLTTFLEAYPVFDLNQGPSVQLKVDDKVSGQRFVDVINCLSGLGIDRVSLEGFSKPVN